MKPRDLAMLFLLASIWGASFLFIRIASPIFGPFALVTYRVILAGFTLLIYVGISRQQVSLRAYWWKFIILGTLNAALPFTLISFATLNLPASFAAILNATTPMFTAVLSALFLGDALSSRKILGLVLGLFGVSLVVGWSPFELTPAVLLAIGASLGAAFFYGTGNVYTRKTFQGVSSLSLAIGQQLGAGLVMLPLAISRPPQTMTTDALIPATILALLCTAFAYLLYFTLIRNVGATNTATVTMLVPFFGIFWGAVLLGETMELGQLVGFGIIVLSLVLVTGVLLPVRKAKFA